MHFESPVLDVSKCLITLLCVSFLNNFILKLDLAAINIYVLDVGPFKAVDSNMVSFILCTSCNLR